VQGAIGFSGYQYSTNSEAFLGAIKQVICLLGLWRFWPAAHPTNHLCSPRTVLGKGPYPRGMLGGLKFLLSIWLPELELENKCMLLKTVGLGGRFIQ